jgi:acyl carrier protein
MKNVVNNEEALHEFLKKMIVEALKLEDLSAGDIDSDTPLFREGLGLDSLDALELVVAIEKHFNVIIEDETVGKKAFQSIRALATFIREEFPQGA